MLTLRGRYGCIADVDIHIQGRACIKIDAHAVGEICILIGTITTN